MRATAILSIVAILAALGAVTSLISMQQVSTFFVPGVSVTQLEPGEHTLSIELGHKEAHLFDTFRHDLEEASDHINTQEHDLEEASDHINTH